MTGIVNIGVPHVHAIPNRCGMYEYYHTSQTTLSQIYAKSMPWPHTHAKNRGQVLYANVSKIAWKHCGQGHITQKPARRQHYSTSINFMQVVTLHLEGGLYALVPHICKHCFLVAYELLESLGQGFAFSMEGTNRLLAMMATKLVYQLGVDEGNRRREGDNSWRFER